MVRAHPRSKMYCTSSGVLVDDVSARARTHHERSALAHPRRGHESCGRGGDRRPASNGVSSFPPSFHPCARESLSISKVDPQRKSQVPERTATHRKWSGAPSTPPGRARRLSSCGAHLALFAGRRTHQQFQRGTTRRRRRRKTSLSSCAKLLRNSPCCSCCAAP